MPQLGLMNGMRVPTASRMKAPPHPFPELQGPFEESMTELERPEEAEIPQDAATRRTMLLDAPTYERVIAGRWKQRPGEKYHPLWKIVAQLSFGIHLLAENMAKSEEEVMQILQGHIDEIDLFLERTTEDFALAQEDIAERMRCLQLPLQHPKVFDRMLEDKTFRNSIVDGNEKIEHIVARTGCAMKDSLKDAQKGYDATSSLAQYLTRIENSWGRRSVDHEAVFDAMLENVEGWKGAFIDLQEQGENLGRLLKQLTDVVNQIQQRAGEISRRLIRAQQRQGHSPTSSKNITYISRQSVSSGGTRSDTPEHQPRKALPGVPSRVSGRQSATQGQRSETSHSARSVTSQRSGLVQPSRASSREGTTPLRDSYEPRMATKSPRLIEIKRYPPHGREISYAASVVPSDATSSQRSSAHPVELPAELPANASRLSPMSFASNVNAGLGIMQSSEHVQSTQQQQQQQQRLLQSSASTRDSPVKDHTGSSNLPLTPNSMNSNGDVNRTLVYELPSEPSTRHVPAPIFITPTSTADSQGSPPSTPAWAKEKFDPAERDQHIANKTAFRSHPPTADLGSPPVMFQNSSHIVPQHSRFNESVASSIGAPGPAVASYDHGVSPQTGSTGGNSVLGYPISASHSTQSVAEGEAPEVNKNNKVFIAELEGTTPITSRPTMYDRGAMRSQAREINHEAVELEVPFQAPASSNTGQEMLPTLPQDHQLEDQIITKKGNHSASTSHTVREDVTQLENKMAAAIRRSFIATSEDALSLLNKNIVPAPAPAPVELEAETKKSGDRPAIRRRKNSSKGVDDIIAQLEQLNASSPNLHSNVSETMSNVTLPATTYVAVKTPAKQPPTPPAPKNSNPEAWSGAETPKSKKGRSARTSIDSTTSSRSQWRAFFKGQLSPDEFNASTPQLPSKVNSTHKAIIELQRRQQESSPTLGWQWAPETPDVESTSKVSRR